MSFQSHKYSLIIGWIRKVVLAGKYIALMFLSLLCKTSIYEWEGALSSNRRDLGSVLLPHQILPETRMTK